MSWVQTKAPNKTTEESKRLRPFIDLEV